MKTEIPVEASPPLNRWPGAVKFFAETVIIILLYTATAKLGFLVAIPPGNVTILWPPSGIAVAAVMLWGYRGCVGIALGAATANIIFLQGNHPLSTVLGVSTGIALGSTLQSAIIGGVLRRYFDLAHLFSSIQPLLKLAIVTFVGCTVAATAGLVSLRLGGLIQRPSYESVWTIWWVGDCLGVLVLAPPMILLGSRIMKRPFAQQTMPAIIWSFSIGISVFIFIFMRRLEFERINAELALDAQTEKNAVEANIRFSIRNLNSIGGLFTASEFVTRDDFKRFVDTLVDQDVNWGGIQAFEWIPRVEADARSQFEATARANGFEYFMLTERGADGKLIPAESRSEYFPVYYVEPMAENSFVVGFDLASDKFRNDALTAARTAGQCVATDPVTLVQDSGQEKGFLIFLPIYTSRNRTNSHPPVSGELRGFALGVFRIVDLVEASLKRVPRRGTEFVILNKNAQHQSEILFSNIASIEHNHPDPNFNPAVLKQGFFHVAQIEVAGRTWEMISRAAPDYVSERRIIQSWILPIAGLGFGMLMILYVMNRQKTEVVLRQKNEELIHLNDEIKKQQAQLLVSEKMSSVGQLAAGIAHEINNPAGFVSGNLTTLKKYINQMLELEGRYDQLLDGVGGAPEEIENGIQSISAFKKEIRYDFLRFDISELMIESVEGMERIARIVKDLRDFSHVENSGVLDMCDLEEMVEKTLNVAWNELKYNCTIHRDYRALPMLRLNRGEINQVILNLLVNAAQAIVDNGDIFVRIFAENNEAVLEIEDTGCGIPEDIQTRIFDPFFTTKPVGEGTGLGLHICQKIVAAHKGRIELRSKLGCGTTFRVLLPIRASGEESKEGHAERDYWQWQP